MPKHQEAVFTSWDGETASLLAEIKRRAGVRTDQELARFLGVAQSTVSHWRVRLRIPESALLRIERLLSQGGAVVEERAQAARLLTLRLPEYWFQSALARGLKGDRMPFYVHVAGCMPAVQQAISEQLAIHERETGKGALQLTSQLLSDDKFLDHLVELTKRL